MADRRVYAAGVLALGLFLAVQLGALALVEPFKTAGYQTVEDPQDPRNSLVYILAILVVTGVMLAAFHFGIDWVVQALVIGAAAFVAFYVFSVLLPPVVVDAFGTPVHAPAIGLAGLLAVALVLYPEWYVIDATGVVMGAGAAALFGISFGILPAILLLVVLAVYDAISVYGTEHMLTLAAGVMDRNLPVVLVIPLTVSYSYLAAEPPAAAVPSEARADPAATPGQSDGATDHPHTDDRDTDDPLERDALFIGLGDAVVPTVLVASAAFFAPGSSDLGVSGLAVTVPALGAILGTLVGLIALLVLVLRGRAHAGLPLLNGGAMAGYLGGALVTGVPLLAALGL